MNEEFFDKNRAKLGIWPDWKRNTLGKMKIPEIKEAARLLSLLYCHEEWYISVGHDDKSIILYTKCAVANIQKTYWDYPLRIEVIGIVEPASYEFI